MARDLIGLSVFIATPGGLEKERKQFFDVLARFNHDQALDVGISFIPEGHELTVGGVGRPQEKINEQVRACDYLVVVFWDWWGTPTDHTQKYTSGTHEEYSVGLESLRDPEAPMRDIVVFFKSVTDKQMGDPGPQLKKVLDFKQQLEEDRQVLYRPFDSIEEFGDELRRLLGSWARDWRSGEAEKAVPPPPAPPVPSGETALEAEESLVAKAKRAAKQGRTTLAHRLFAQATAAVYDREAWTEYVRFLRRAGRHGLLQVAADEMIEKARDLGDHLAAAEAFSNLGIARRVEGNRTTAISYFDDALRELDELERESGLSPDSQSMRAFVLDNKGLTWRRMRDRMPDALEAIRTAIALHESVGDARGKAHGLRNVGVIGTQIGRLEDSLASLSAALEIFEAAEDQRSVAMTLSAIGEALEMDGRIGEAIDTYERALEVNTDSGNRQGKSMNLSQLSRAFLAYGDRSRANEYAQACLEYNEKAGEPEGLAAGLQAVGRVSLDADDLDRAIELLRGSYEIFEDLDQPAGLAATSLGLADAHLRRREAERARLYLDVAEAALDSSPHFALSRQLGQLREALQATA